MVDAPRIAIPIPTSADFEYNRRSWPMYAEAVRQAGGVAVAIELTAGRDDVMREAAGCDGVLLPGSPADVDPQRYGHERKEACAPADPARERMDWQLLEEAFRAGKPVLGVCFGMQSMNVWRGGTLRQDLPGVPVNHGAGASVAVAHAAALESDGLLAGLVSVDEARTRDGTVCFPVNSSHHQAVEMVGEGLRVAAWSVEDGVTEALEGDGGREMPAFVLGVQWHPERSIAQSSTSREIFLSFIEAASGWKLAASSRG